MIGVNLSRLSLGMAMLAMALLASGCSSAYGSFLNTHTGDDMDRPQLVAQPR